jgi:hypothetical protein
MNTPTIQVPAIPADWIAHSGVIPAGNGLRTHVAKVLHTCDGYMPYVIHRAFESNGKWAYEGGQYFSDPKEAQTAYDKKVV